VSISEPTVYALKSKLDPVQVVLDNQAMALCRSAMCAAKVGQPGILCRFVAHRGATVGEGLGRQVGDALGAWLAEVKPGKTTLKRLDFEDRLLTREEWLAIMQFAAFNARHAPYEVW